MKIRTRADRSRLRIHNVLLSDAGVYTLKATNRDRIATENVTLTVLCEWLYMPEVNFVFKPLDDNLWLYLTW